MGCSFRPDWVAGFLRMRWQLCTGLGGRNYRNTHPSRAARAPRPQNPAIPYVLCPFGLCRKVAFETICAMVSPGDLWCTERENDDGDQFQGSPLSAGYYSDGCAVVCRLPLELPACRRADAGTRCAGRPRDDSAVGGEIQPSVGSGVSSPQAVGVAQLAHGSVPDATCKNAPLNLSGFVAGRSGPRVGQNRPFWLGSRWQGPTRHTRSSRPAQMLSADESCARTERSPHTPTGWFC